MSTTRHVARTASLFGEDEPAPVQQPLESIADLNPRALERARARMDPRWEAAVLDRIRRLAGSHPTPTRRPK